MSAQMTVTKRFISANAHAVNIDLGFIPDLVRLIWGLDDTKPKIFEWYRQQYVDEAADKYGLAINGDGDGTTATPTSADDGIIPFNTTYHGVWIPHPASDLKKIFRTPTEYYAAAAFTDWTSYRARTGVTMDTAIAGDVCLPLVRNGYVYELTTATGQPNTSPTWPTVPGESVTDQASNVWICRKQMSGVYSPQGIQIGVNLQVNSDVCLLTAILGLDRSNLGDAENFYPTT